MTDEYVEMVVSRRAQITPDVIELDLVPREGGALPTVAPGAHIALRLLPDMVRQYSLVLRDAAQQPLDAWTIAVLVDPNGRGGSRLIGESLVVGSRVDVSPPRNHFEFEPGSDGNVIFVAGGIGITPLIGMLDRAASAGLDWQLLYGGRNEASMAYLPELQQRFGDRVQAFPVDQGQLIDIEGLADGLKPGQKVYCCGPEPMIHALESALERRGKLDSLRFERFSPRDDDAAAPNFEFEVVAAASKTEFIVPADESILMAADFEGIEVPGDCMEGTCGSCVTRVLAGQVDHRDSVLTAAQRAANDRMMICVSRAAPGCKTLALDM